MSADEEMRASRAPAVRFEGVELAYGDRAVLRGLTFEVPARGITVLLGGSGSGKSTTLKVIGGLVRPDAGRVLVAGEDVARASERALREARRGMGMMFQNGALLDSLTVFDNLAFPLREHTRSSAVEVAAAVREALGAVGLQDAEGLLPRELSGGMTKRVALARALMTSPALVLCDEPFSGLDPVGIKRIEAMLRAVADERGLAMLVVSHDVPSTLRLADRVVFLLDGVAHSGPPASFLDHPEPRIAAFFDLELGAALTWGSA